MTVKLLPGVGVYHTSINKDGSTDEHITKTPVRVTPTHYILYCEKCKAVSTTPRDTDSEELRFIEESIKEGHDLKEIKTLTSNISVMVKEDGTN